jgi:hypothetical protein
MNMQNMCTWNGRICKRCVLEIEEDAKDVHLKWKNMQVIIKRYLLKIKMKNRLNLKALKRFSISHHIIIQEKRVSK